MKELYYWMFGVIGLFLTILGLFDMSETKFGFESTTSLFGIVIMFITILYNRIDKLEEQVSNKIIKG